MPKQSGRIAANARSGAKRRSLLRRIITWIALAALCFYAAVTLAIVVLRWIAPPTTAVQAERRVAALLHGSPYRKVFTFVPIDQISTQLRHAVVAAEDARFYEHHGFDWKEVHIAVEEGLEGGRSRGASTITQQLVRNLFLSTGRSFIRKGIEFTIVPITELLLSKRRILELYLNVVEWGPGIYGAEAAAQRSYRVHARQLSRDQAIGLASVLPSPLRRRPGQVPYYSRIIAERMSQMGW